MTLDLKKHIDASRRAKTVFTDKKAVVLAIVAVAVVSLFLVFFYRQNMDSALKIIDGKNIEIEKNIINNVVSSLKNVSIHLSVLAKSYPGENSPSSKETSLRVMWEQLNSDSNIASIFVGYENGDFLQARRTPAMAIREINGSSKKDIWTFKEQNYSTIQVRSLEADFDARNRVWYKNADKNGEFYWTDPYKFASTGAMGLTASLPVMDERGKKLKVVGADFTLEALNALLKEQSQALAGDIAIFSADGKIVSSSFASQKRDKGCDALSIPKTNDLKTISAYKEILAGKLKGETVDEKMQKKYLYYAMKFPQSFKKEWYIVSFADKNIAVEDARNSLYAAMAEVFVVLSLIIGSAIYWTFVNEKIKTQLANSNLLMKKLLDSLPNPIFYKDKRGSFMGFNKAYERAFGVDGKDLLGKTVMDLEYLPLEDRLVYNDEDINTIKNCSTIVREQDMRFADDKTHNTVYSVNGFADSNGDPAGLIGVFTDITKQKETMVELERTKQKAEALYRQTNESIEYASFIQHTLLPSRNLFKKFFPEYFAIWRPRHIVGGDIYFFEELQEGQKALLMVIDCTGHGVHGAFLTMFVKALERQLMSGIKYDYNSVSPANILSFFNKNMKKLLLQEDDSGISDVGFDGAVLYYDKSKKIIKFAGARTPLFYVEDGEVLLLKGDRASIGYKNSDVLRDFTDYELKVKEGMGFYLTTDGYLDQNGGDKGFPFGKTRFLNIIKSNHKESFADQQEIFLDELRSYQKNEIRNDDITLIGFKI